MFCFISDTHLNSKWALLVGVVCNVAFCSSSLNEAVEACHLQRVALMREICLKTGE